MKFLINPEFVALRKGLFVEADEESGEFVLDTEHVEYSKGTLEEIAAANEITISKSLNKGDYAEALAHGLNDLEIGEVNKMTDLQKAKEIVLAGFEADKTDEEMIVEIIGSGVKFKEAGKLFKQVCETEGLRISPKDRKAHISKILADAEFAPEKAEDVSAMVARIIGTEETDDEEAVNAEVANTSEKQALQAIRVWAKDNEVSLPKADKKEKAAASTHGLGSGTRGRIIDWMLQNPDATEVDLLEGIRKIRKDGTEELVLKGSAERFYSYLKFARLINKTTDDESAE